MSQQSNSAFTVKFFRPPQRTVSCNNGLLDTRTKHTIAQDRLIVAEQRILDVERQKSASQIQLLAFEQKQVEKRFLSLHNFDQSLQIRRRSISETNLHQTSSWNDTTEMTHSKLYASLHHSYQNLLSLLKIDDYPILISDPESSEEESLKSIKMKIIQPPIVAVIPPEDDD